MKKSLIHVVSALALTTACATEPPSAVEQTASAAAQPAAANKPAAEPASRPKAASPAPVAAAKPQPRVRQVQVPAGTTLSLALDTAVSSKDSKIEDVVRAKLAQPIIVGGETIVPAGAEVVGSVFDAQQSGRVKGRATVSFGFDRLTTGGVTHTIQTARITREAEATKSEDATKVGIGAGAGALIGALAGGKKGAAIGTAVGAGAGTATVLATRGEEVTLAAGTVVETATEQPITIQVAVK
ncbi:MAG: hypothetical protein WBD07_13865 [Vicinamibacterales bacterium]